MSSIIMNKERIANVTSSQAYRLISKGRDKVSHGAPFYSYVEEKRIEKRLKRCIDTDVYTQSIMWGNFLERRVHTMLPFEYELMSNETSLHPTIEGWAGSRDFLIEGVKISELKCYQLKKFCLYTDALLSKDIDRIKKDFPEEYWQAVSSALIANVDTVELMSYCPYQSELEEIREEAANYEGELDLWKIRFIYESEDSALPYLIDGEYYKNLNQFEFKPPKEDFEELERCAKAAINLIKQ